MDRAQLGAHRLQKLRAKPLLRDILEFHLVGVRGDAPQDVARLDAQLRVRRAMRAEGQI
ncbi:hypothetical protein D3C72_2353200 [compost metagenome]